MTEPSAGRQRILIQATLTIALVLGHSRCSAQAIKDVAAGHELSSKLCSQCHLVAPLPGPSFMDIAKGEYGSSKSLESFLRSTHNDVSHPGGMPRMDLPPDQMRAIASYITSLRETR